MNFQLFLHRSILRKKQASVKETIIMKTLLAILKFKNLLKKHIPQLQDHHDAVLHLTMVTTI